MSTAAPFAAARTFVDLSRRASSSATGPSTKGSALVRPSDRRRAAVRQDDQGPEPSRGCRHEAGDDRNGRSQTIRERPFCRSMCPVGGRLPEVVVRRVVDLLHLAGRLRLALGGGRLGPTLGVEPLDVSRCVEAARADWDGCCLQQKLLNVLRSRGIEVGGVPESTLPATWLPSGACQCGSVVHPARRSGCDDLPVVAGQSGPGATKSTEVSVGGRWHL